MFCDDNKSMPDVEERGSAFLFLVIIFVVVAGVAAFVVLKTITTSTEKVASQTNNLTVALKSEYENPFDKDTQYENPFNSYHNPFDELK